MKDQLHLIKKNYLELKNKLNQIDVSKNVKNLIQWQQELHQLTPVYDLIKKYENINLQIQENKKLLKTESETDICSLIKEDNQNLLKQLSATENHLKIKLLPQDPNDTKNVILEIRAGTGGDEASLFVQNIFESYHAFALSQSWKIDIISISEGNVGGYKEIIVNISGNKVYSFLKYESGVHRVQRVPKTESQGRIHTSTITVVVLPEADPIQVQIKDSDLRIDVYRSSGAGGQHVNTTDSAVRIVHLPTKITVSCQQEKSQHSNRDKALKILYARLMDHQKETKQKNESQKRQDQIAGGDRSQRIRTYNFPQSRITDHRVPITKNLNPIMQGQFLEIIDSVISHYRQQSLNLANKK